MPAHCKQACNQACALISGTLPSCIPVRLVHKHMQMHAPPCILCAQALRDVDCLHDAWAHRVDGTRLAVLSDPPVGGHALLHACMRVLFMVRAEPGALLWQLAHLPAPPQSTLRGAALFVLPFMFAGLPSPCFGYAALVRRIQP